MNSPKTSSPPASSQDFPIVGIGASAGGLDAFKKFLKSVPENTGMAYVFVQHLAASHESILPEILARVTKLPVNEITDEIHLAPDNVYVIPPNKTLSSTDGVLKLTPREKIKTNNLIDVFFSSIAEVHQSLAVGVVLSGTGTDGTLGLKAIKEYGGITFAQDPQTAAYPGMPQSAITMQVADFILVPEKIPEKIAQISDTYKSTHSDPEEKLLHNDEAVFKQILFLLRQRCGVDFTHYKQTTVRRRIARRIAISKTEKLSDYLRFMRRNKAEQDALFQDMLIPVTSFFRDSEIFKTLSEDIFPLLLKNKPAQEPVRIWSAGCSTGQEAFSIAICLCEFLGENPENRRIQIFASDISEKSIATARKAVFSKDEVGMFPETLLKKYFTKTGGDYLVSKSIRDMCVFAVQNFVKDPPFAKMDLISCRNALIYLEPFLQKKALTNFHYALNKKGFLLLGKSETTGCVAEMFSAFNKNDKIYSPNLIKERFMLVASERHEEVLTEKSIKSHKPEILAADFRKSAEAILLNNYTPANVIINEQMDIVYIHGEVSPFIEPSQGKPSFNLIKMAREGLGFELRNAIHAAREGKIPVIKQGIQIKSNEKLLQTTLEVIPLLNTLELYFLVIFHKAAMAEVSRSLNEPDGMQSHEDAQMRIQQLEKELLQIREDMRSITEDQEAANEELQSANEELLSGSEELQSLNEELESSKEELQSTNEELVIVNHELIDKNEQLNSSQLYSDAIIATLREPLVVLSRSLRVKVANTAFYKKFNIHEQDVEGRLLYEIQNYLFDNSMLRAMLDKNLTKRSELLDCVVVLNHPPQGDLTFLVNAKKVVTSKAAKPLILLSFEDITERRNEEKRKKKISEELEAQIKERNLLIKQNQTQLDQFTHTTSHEFQEPLRKIIIFSKLLQQSGSAFPPEKTKEYLGKIEDASIRMTKLINDTLNFASVTNHEKLLEKTDLNVILTNILFDFDLLITEKNAKIISEELPVIDAVPFQMNQLFYDLIYNALKFSRPDVPPLIHISCGKIPEADLRLYPNLISGLEYVGIKFKDNGIGFDQKYAKQIFTLFQRLNTMGDYPGTGVGLALCKKIVDHYHGDISARGKENKGAEFLVILPVKQPGS